jgi:hypothetical protein
VPVRFCHVGPLVAPMVERAGQDITEWFDHLTGDVRFHVDPETSLSVPYHPQGRFMHVPPKDPTSDWKNDFGTPWWRDEKYFIGNLSKSTRLVRIVNVLTKQEKLLEVCAEESLAEILDRYLAWNKHAGSYTWKGLIDGEFVPLDMDKTLEENDIPDEATEFERLSIEEEFYFPILHLYFNDDLTVA